MGSPIDAATTGNAFRCDFPQVLACDRHQAYLGPARVYNRSGATGVLAGTVMARNSNSGMFEPYQSGAASGLDTARGILFQNVYPAPSNDEMGIMIFQGKVYENKVVGLDSTGRTNLDSRSIIDANGDQILIF